MFITCLNAKSLLNVCIDTALSITNLIFPNHYMVCQPKNKVHCF